MSDETWKIKWEFPSDLLYHLCTCSLYSKNSKPEWLCKSGKFSTQAQQTLGITASLKKFKCKEIKSLKNKKQTNHHFYYSDTLWLHLTYFDWDLSKIFHILVIALMKFFKTCGLGQSKKMKTQNKNERMKKVRRIKQKTALPVQISSEVLTFT